jgi:hypothetical protein
MRSIDEMGRCVAITPARQDDEFSSRDRSLTVAGQKPGERTKASTMSNSMVNSTTIIVRRSSAVR